MLEIDIINGYSKEQKSINMLHKESGFSHKKVRKLLVKSGQIIRSDKQQQQIDYNFKRGKRLNLITDNIEKNHLFFYVLGAFKGDGHYAFDKYAITMNVTDIDFLLEIKRIFSLLSPQTRVLIKKHVEAKVNSKEQFRLNIISKDFFKKKLFLLKPITKEEKISYLRGLFDAEGSIIFFKKPVKKIRKTYIGHDKALTISQKNIIDLEEWNGYLEELGIKSMKSYKDDGRSSLNLRRNESIRLFHELIGFKIKRKQDKLNEVIDYINKCNLVHHRLIKRKKIISIKEIGEEETYDIETPEYHNFILENKIISHNSVMGMTICAYLASLIVRKGLNPNPYDATHIFFDSRELMTKAQEFPKFSIIHYDEARESLAASKAMNSFQQDMLDFLTECGQRNNLYIIILPDYYDLREIVAVGRSECLINVFRKDIPIKADVDNSGIIRDIVRFERGYFKFYNRNAKNLLFDLFRCTKQKNYNSVQSSFPTGQFENQYPIKEELYRQMKTDALTRFKTGTQKTKDKNEEKTIAKNAEKEAERERKRLEMDAREEKKLEIQREKLRIWKEKLDMMRAGKKGVYLH